MATAGLPSPSLSKGEQTRQDILQAAIATARAERADDMGAVTGKDHPVMHKPFQPAAVEGID